MQRLEVVRRHLAPLQGQPCAAAPSDKNSMQETRAMEEKRCEWSVDELELLLDREAVEAKRVAFATVLADPVLGATDMDQFEKTAFERREQSTRRLVRFAELVKGKTEDEEFHLIRAMSCVDSGTTIRWFVQRLLWIETIRNQGSAEQIEFWTNGAREYALVGCFGMTELGSSSHLRGAETEAIYHHATRSFTINSPTVTATKIWIGQAGQIATHCIVFANLKVEGKGVGIQLFIVQIRDQRTGLPMPGIEVGDMGPKVGLDGNDNGFIRFSNVRVPYSHMLCRWAQIDEAGNFIEAPLAALAYGSTIAERLVSYYMYDRLALYSAVMWCLLRRQGPPVNGLQPQIMDYPSHYTKLMPCISYTYVGKACSYETLKRYRSMLADLRAGDQQAYLMQLAEMHAVACAQKSFFSWLGMDTMETCRRLMGGHAFHQYMGVGRYLGDSGVGTTGGGDNNVLVKQTGTYLVKLSRTRSSKLSAFLFEDLKPNGLLTNVDNLEEVLHVFSIRARNAVRRAKDTKGVLDLVTAAENWYWRLVLASCLDYIKELPKPAPLIAMWKLVALSRLLLVFPECVIDQTVSAAALYDFRKQHEALSWAIRQNALNLVLAFGIPEQIMRNPLVVKDGGYEAYLNAMRNNRFNKTKVAPYWKDLIGPLQKPHLYEKKE